MHYTALVLPIFALAQAASASFAASCGPCGLAAGNKLQCVKCKKSDGSYSNVPELFLGDCYANKDGQIIFTNGGHFEKTCQGLSINLWGDNYELKATCGDGKGHTVENMINLDDRIHNLNGNLRCY